MSSYSFTLTAPGPTPSPGSGSGPAGYAAKHAARGTIGGWDLRFDPVTLDLIDDGFGAFELVTSAATAVLHQLLCHRDEWWGDPELGSHLHQLDRFIQDPGPLIAAECERALGVLVRAGRLADVRADAEESAPGRVSIRTSYRDTRSGQPVDLTLTPAGG